MIVLAGLALAADGDEEMKRLEGRFERSVTNEAGTVFRVVKDVAAGESTVTTYDDVGRVVSAHTSKFKVEKRGDVQVFTFFDLKVTAGPEKGREIPAPSSYIYRYDGAIFTEAWGLLAGDETPPRMMQWRKVK
jgi:hypothetical protein